MDHPLPLPDITAKAFVKYAKGTPPCQNPSLIFDRFMPAWQNQPEIYKSAGLDLTIQASKQTDPELLAAWNMRWEKTVAAAKGLGFELQTDWRLIAGLGRKGSLEVGFTFHRYGFPYLPGSSLKGLARSWAVIEIGAHFKDKLEYFRKISGNKSGLLAALDLFLTQEQEEKFENGLQECGASDAIVEATKRFRAIFGTTAHGGHIVFFDAIPRNNPKLELDIMNPHYPLYYREGSTAYPTAWQDPIPVKFLTVAPGTIIRFAVGWRRAPIDATPLTRLPEKEQKKWSWFKNVTRLAEPDATNQLLPQAQEWLTRGVSELGAGGKTSAGYGYFNPVTDSGKKTAGEKHTLPAGFERGMVKDWGLGPSQSYGFITRSNGEDLFVHRNQLSEGLTQLQTGQKVIFRVGRGPRGNQAQDVQSEK